MLKDLLQPTIFCDKNATIMLSKNHVFKKKTKHIDTMYHFIRELVNKKEICLEFYTSKEQVANIFTKALERDAFQYQHNSLRVRTVTNE
jgi:hypothetical protein